MSSRPPTINVRDDAFPPKAQPYIEEALTRIGRTWQAEWELSGMFAQAAQAPGMNGSRFAELLKRFERWTNDHAGVLRRINEELAEELAEMDVLA